MKNKNTKQLVSYGDAKVIQKIFCNLNYLFIKNVCASGMIRTGIECDQVV